MRLVESFTSLQGESTHAGRICHFLRLAGCNLSCNYCDTRYAQSFDAGEAATVDDLINLAQNSGVKLVEITGGEPLASKETPELCRRLINAGFEVLLETNGSLSIAEIPREVCKIVDCKLPDSGMAEANDVSNYDLLTSHDEIKFVVSSRADFDWALEEIKRYNLESKCPNLLFSPVWGRVKFADLAEWVVKSRAPIRMQLQMHKQIWGDRPGV
ncbi:MAG: radical SAM protein [Victivallales bacterium]|jgi:7-carboxy-7-deazaguanine synthase|nr:radical SAM protein [Victivallales bacterium]